MGRGVPAVVLKDLSAPTPDEEKKQRIAPGGSGKMLTYIDARYVMDTLDRVCHPENWQNEFRLDGNGNLTCGIGILVSYVPEGVEVKDIPLFGPPEWVWKWDVGTESSIEATKGNFSDAFKRAGVHWGIARDLYDERSAPAGGFRHNPASLAHAFGPDAGGPVVSPAARSAATAPLVSDWRCPVHGTYKVVPAGVSKRTMKPYAAFVVCSVDGCLQKAPRGTKPIVPVVKTDAYVGMGDDIGELDDDTRNSWRDGVEFDSSEQ